MDPWSRQPLNPQSTPEKISIREPSPSRSQESSSTKPTMWKRRTCFCVSESQISPTLSIWAKSAQILDQRQSSPIFWIPSGWIRNDISIYRLGTARMPKKILVWGSPISTPISVIAGGDIPSAQELIIHRLNAVSTIEMTLPVSCNFRPVSKSKRLKISSYNWATLRSWTLLNIRKKVLFEL